MTKLIVAFRNFAYAPKKQNLHHKCFIYNHGLNFEILRLAQIIYKNDSSHCIVDMLHLCYVETNDCTGSS